MQAVILAGGLGTRLGARTRDLPKALLPIAGRPFLAWLVEALARHGYRELVLCIGHHGEQIVDFLGAGEAFGLDVRYSKDGERLLGTGGAVRQALSRDLLADRFLVTYGDSYLPFDYAAPLRDLDAHPEALGTMSVFETAARGTRATARSAEAWCCATKKASKTKPSATSTTEPSRCGAR